MKIINGILFVLMILAINNIAQEREKSLKIISFDTSIHCDGCKTTIIDSLPKEEGISDVKVEVQEKIVTVIFNPSIIKMESIVEKINELGYSAYILDFNDFEEEIKQEKLESKKNEETI